MPNRVLYVITLLTLLGCSPGPEHLPESSAPQNAIQTENPIAFDQMPDPVIVTVDSSRLITSEKIFFDKYGVQEGLPEEYVKTVLQDDEGFIWATTQNGLVKYDGYEMQVFQGNRNDPDALWSRNLIGGLIMGSDQRLWIGGISTGGGLTSYNPRTRKFKHYENIAESDTQFASCWLLTEDPFKNIWFIKSANPSSLLCRLDPVTDSIHCYPYHGLWLPVNPIILSGTFAMSGADNNIWLLNDGSLLKFNRASDTFEEIFRKGDPIPGIPYLDTIGNIITAGKSGLIPMANNRHVHLWDPVQQQVVYTYDFPPRDIPSVLESGGIEDTYGNFWFSSYDHMARFDPRKHTLDVFNGREILPGYFGDGQNSAFIPPMYQDSSSLWFCILDLRLRTRGYMRYDYHSDKYIVYDYNFNETSNQISQNSNIVTASLIKDQSGSLWLGTRPNLYKQNTRKQLFTHYTNDSKNPVGLPSDSIMDILEDSEQKLWIATRNGLAVTTGESGKYTIYHHEPNNKNSLSIDVVDRVFEDSKRNIWLGVRNGINLWKRETNTFYRVITFDSHPYTWGMTISEDGLGRIWASINEKGVYVMDNQGNVLKHYFPDAWDSHDSLKVQITRIYHDSHGNTWMGDPYGSVGLYRFNDFDHELVHYTNPEWNKEVLFIIEDKEENLWIGCDGQMLRYDYQTDHFERHSDPIKGNSFSGYAFDQRGDIWFSTYAGGGLVSIDPESGAFTSYGVDKGLLHNDIYPGTNRHLVTDDYGNIWLPTESGLSVFSPDTQTFRNFTDHDGYSIDYKWDGPAIKASNGDIWMGGTNGLYHMDPSKLLQKDPIPPGIMITGITVGDSTYTGPDGHLFTKSVSYTSKITLRYWQKSLGFYFVALHYLRPEDNLYSWKLENFDENWTAPSKNRHATYTNLSPGTYTFHVKGSNADGVWNESGASIAIRILPPWWNTWWAYVIYVVIFAGLILGIRKYEMRRMTDRAEAQRLKEIDTMKSKLYANITHEFRTPLTVIMGMADEIADDQQRNLITRNSRKLLQFVNEMLDLSRMDSGSVRLENQQGDIIYYLNYLTESFYSMATDRDIHLTFYSEVPRLVMDYDEKKLQQVIYNLLSNALKFTKPKGKVVLHATQLDATHLQLKVQDTGIGIPEKSLALIFDRFFQVDSSLTRQGEGTGIGLSLTKEYVELMGGTISVSSIPGEGTEFTVVLPILHTAPVTKANGHHKKPDTIAAAGSVDKTAHDPVKTGPVPDDKPLLLLIDDNIDVVSYIEGILSAAYRVETADNGRTGLEKALQIIPDIIVSDVMMPEMDGFTLTKTLKTDKRTSHIPIILITARAEEQDRVKGFQSGADAYLSKPFSKQELLVRLEKLTALKRDIE